MATRPMMCLAIGLCVAVPIAGSTSAAAVNARNPSVRLAVAGDVGTGGDEEWRTAGAMDQLETGHDFDALLLLGDNVYPNGDPADLQRVVFDPFAGVLDGTTRLLPVLGNHDVLTNNGDGQVAAFGMPGRWYATTIGNVLIVSLDSTRAGDPAQLAWLDETLATSPATWKIAMMHHPPYSGGVHGSSHDVRASFSPLFERHGVQVALAGHDHDYQRSRPVEGVTYVVSGGAAKLRPTQRVDPFEIAESRYHFVEIAVWPTRLELSAVDQTGTVFDSVVLTVGLCPAQWPRADGQPVPPECVASTALLWLASAAGADLDRVRQRIGRLFER